MADESLVSLLHRYFPFGFQTSRDGWDRFELPALLAHEEPFSDENARYTVRRLADRYNQRPPAPGRPVVPVLAEQWLSLGILNDALRYVLLHYALRQKPGALADAYQWARRRVGEDRIDRLPVTFAGLFPPPAVLIDRQDPAQWLAGGEPELDGRSRVSVEAVLLYLMARNPATRAFRDLFDDGDLQRRASYVPFVVSLEEYFDAQEPSGLSGETLFHTLRAPILASPDDLDGQLAYIRRHWGHLLPAAMLARLDLVRDLLAEMSLARAPVYGPPPVLEFGGEAWHEAEPAAFSRDADWMSNVVLMAKSTYVWLDQLSRRHGREIRTLAQVPDEELDRLARWGFSGLWLIGLWERSAASRKIKQFAGNPDAVASAYSLHDYTIAADLGGADAYHDLRERAWRRGIRLASDMVPNHMGIDSRWVIEHPHWFLQGDRPPYPGYRFTGGDLCDHPDVEVRIEEGYWTRTDAAVVFERHDTRSGERRYIYHGNDGTSMPWNDTAQLDFTNPEVREAVIQTILHVARQFPIIRFDAAMTLARKHYQRLWFPAPGDAGAIPSRAEHGMSREQFRQLMPVEFWREVVDRVAREVPDTLLLAEAFWLMEGYFVRTLGMHRVYNSAFMNMLKMEENQKYRQTIKNVLEFSPAVLQRFVNFMNNPDERTAVEQFGKGDKYFGVAVMLVTMPGLPMVGHGQVEGFAEKYGMEYKRAYWDEPVDEDMVRRHERDVFPLMRRRSLFSGAQNFALYDFIAPDGHVDENVFAYTNRHDAERALVLYNNAYQGTRGHLHTSTPINVAPADHDPRHERRSLVEALGLDASPGVYYSFRETVSGLEFLRNGEDLARNGLHASLHGYQYQTFLDWRELRDHDGRWGALHHHLAGRGVPSLRRAQRERELTPLLARLPEVFGADALTALAGGAIADLGASWQAVLSTAAQVARPAAATSCPTATDLRKELQELMADRPLRTDPATAATGPVVRDPADEVAPAPGLVAAYLVWAQRHLTAAMGTAVAPEPGAETDGLDADRWRLDRDDLDILHDHIRPALTPASTGDRPVDEWLAATDLLARHGGLLGPRVHRAWAAVFTDENARKFLHANQFEGIWYFHKEALGHPLCGSPRVLPRLGAVTAAGAAACAGRLIELAAAAGYQQQALLDGLAPPQDSPSRRVDMVYRDGVNSCPTSAFRPSVVACWVLLALAAQAAPPGAGSRELLVAADGGAPFSTISGAVAVAAPTA
ncbi:MAG: alpha-amylase family glycosyl hydrolase [Candidatus Krumholzibacteriia bacterium]